MTLLIPFIARKVGRSVEVMEVSHVSADLVCDNVPAPFGAGALFKFREDIATTNRNNPHEVRCVLSHRRRKHCFSYSTEDLVQLLLDLLKGVKQRHALVMVTLILVAIPIAFLNELNSIAALALVRGADCLSVFDKPQRDALARLFLSLRGGGFDVAGIFWDLWLFPLEMLVYSAFPGGVADAWHVCLFGE